MLKGLNFVVTSLSDLIGYIERIRKTYGREILNKDDKLLVEKLKEFDNIQDLYEKWRDDIVTVGTLKVEIKATIRVINLWDYNTEYFIEIR